MVFSFQPKQGETASPISPKFTGRGLGLSAVQGIARGHQGFVFAKSLAGIGSTFQIYPPVMGKKKRSSKHKKNSPYSKPGKQTHGTVLFADDEPTIRGLCEELLCRMGIEVLLAANGKEAIQKYEENKDSIQCVVLDLMMPKMDGVAALEKIRSIQADIPVLIASGYPEDEIADQFTTCKPYAIIQKPFRLNELRDRILEALNIGS